jgi:hypothetical protein
MPSVLSANGNCDSSSASAAFSGPPTGDRCFSKPAAGEWAAARQHTDEELTRLAVDTHRNQGRAGADLVPLAPARRFVTAVCDLVAGW